MSDEESGSANPPEPYDPAVEEARIKASWERYINYRWTRAVECPICGGTSWKTGSPADMDARYHTGKVLTYMPVRCDTCSYTIFFNLVTAGLYEEGNPVDWYPPAEPEPEPPAPSEPEGDTPQ